MFLAAAMVMHVLRGKADGSLKKCTHARQLCVSRTDHGWHRTGTRTGTRLLLIEDDTVLGAAVRDQIAADGHSVDWVLRRDAAGDAAKSTS
jgi:hypothetical protein